MIYKKIRSFTIVFVLVLGLLAGCSKGKAEVYEEDFESFSLVEESEVSEESGKLFVYVCGEIKNPGVYELPEGSRLYEAITAAGGFTKNAAESYLNQAELLSDEQQIYVPSKDELEAPEIAVEDEASDGKVNLNTATKEALLGLSGIGEVKAQAILDYRQEHGAFSNLEDIKKVPGIGEGVFNKIKEDIKI